MMEAETGQEKPRLQSYAHKVADNDAGVVTYEADFDVPPGFGEVGAVLVTNEHHTEMFLEDVNLYSSSASAGSNSDSDSDDGDDGARAAPLLAIRCKSWVAPKSADAKGNRKRVFFANKVTVIGLDLINYQNCTLLVLQGLKSHELDKLHRFIYLAIQPCDHVKPSRSFKLYIDRTSSASQVKLSKQCVHGL